MFLKLADWIVYTEVGLQETSNFTSALHFFIYDIVKILFLLFTIISIIAFARSYIDNQAFKNYIKKQPKILAHLLASLFGAVTPFCSCSSIPLFIGFIEAGIPFGVSMSFLITSPMINEIAIVVLAGVIGWKVTALYIITGIMVGCLGGWLMEKLGFEKYLQDYLNAHSIQSEISPCKCSCKYKKEQITIKAKLKDTCNYTLGLMKRIWLYVLIGVGVGAVLHGYIPSEFFIRYMGDNNIFAIPLAVITGIPLYADVTTIIPIAQVLINKGAAVGTVLVFMMAVVGLSLPEMIILSRVMKKELIIRFVIFMFITFTFVGYFYNWVL